MEIYQLRYFAYAAKYENITMAAQELNVSQPSISKAIQSLERELKTELLRKTEDPVCLPMMGIYCRKGWFLCLRK